jgi:hypothetical protein
MRVARRKMRWGGVKKLVNDDVKVGEWRPKSTTIEKVGE